MRIADTQGLGHLSDLVKALELCNQATTDAEAVLKEAKQKAAKLSEEEIPELMASLGMSQIKLDTGESLTIEKMYFAKIPSNREEEAFAWLRNNDLGSIIKDIVIRRTNVHPQTLKAVVRERMEDGKNIPEDLFGVFVKNITKIK